MAMDLGGMGFSRVVGDFGDLQNSSIQQQNRIIEVVVLDLTHATKTVYQLNRNSEFSDDDLKRIKQGTLTFSHDSFLPIGEMATMDKKDKQIILTDGNTITYNHLITVTGMQPTLLSYEFLAGLYTLVDALRLNKSVSDILIPPQIAMHKLNINITLTDGHNKKIESLGNKKMPNKRPEQATVLVSELNKKLYQVQI